MTWFVFKYDNSKSHGISLLYDLKGIDGINDYKENLYIEKF